MNCPICKCRTTIAKTYKTTIDGKTYINRDIVCINPRCTNYAGTDLNNPKAIIATETKEEV